MNNLRKHVLALLEKNNLTLDQFVRNGSKCLPILDDNEFKIKFYQKHKHDINDFLYKQSFTAYDLNFLELLTVKTHFF